MEKRTRTVAVRLSPAEHAVWLAAAGAAGRGRLGSWVRDEVAASLDGARGGVREGRAARVDPGVEGLAALRVELARVGNNLNQAVRLVHVQGVDPVAVAQLEAAVGQVREVVAKVVELSTAVPAGGAKSAGRAGSAGGSSSTPTPQRSGFAPTPPPTPVAVPAPVPAPGAGNPWVSGGGG